MLSCCSLFLFPCSSCLLVVVGFQVSHRLLFFFRLLFLSSSQWHHCEQHCEAHTDTGRPEAAHDGTQKCASDYVGTDVHITHHYRRGCKSGGDSTLHHHKLLIPSTIESRTYISKHARSTHTHTYALCTPACFLTQATHIPTDPFFLDLRYRIVSHTILPHCLLGEEQQEVRHQSTPHETHTHPTLSIVASFVSLFCMSARSDQCTMHLQCHTLTLTPPAKRPSNQPLQMQRLTS